MLVKNYMSSNLVTIQPTATVLDAIDEMRLNGIHRLPVVVDGELKGLITEAVVTKYSPSKATSLSMHELNYLLNKTTVQDIMLKRVDTISPDALLEEAAVMMRSKNIGVLVVVEGTQPVGIITEKDVFDAFINVSGYFIPGTRLVVDLQKDHAGIMEEVGHIFKQHEWNVPQISLYHVQDGVQMVLHLDTQDGETARQRLTEAGYNVTSMVIKPEN